MNRWPPAPDRLPPLGADIHLWALDLDPAHFDFADWQPRLSPDEQARASRFKFERDRRRHVIAHAALRDILGAYVHGAPASLKFDQGPNGKPKLAPPFDASGVEFNLSHSHEIALVAVNRGHDIGVDIEFASTAIEIFDVAKRFFTRREVAALAALPTPLRLRAFYKCWTSKEAFLKAKGSGLSGELDEVEIVFTGGQVQIKAAVSGWSLAELDAAQGYEAALAFASRTAQVFCYRWAARG